MARIKIEQVNEYYNVELLDVFPDEVCILGGGYIEEEAIAEMKSNAETWLEYKIEEAKVDKYWNDIWKHNCCEWEVVGNVYDNPELLEEL